MRLTERDVRLIRDVSLSHILSRDQILGLRYFSSKTRVNTRLRDLCRNSLVTAYDTPFFGQRLYTPGRRAGEVVGERIARLLAGRRPSPQFVQHALAVTEIRIKLTAEAGMGWRFEPQIRHRFTWLGCLYDIRPDGLAISAKGCSFVEADLGHVSLAKIRDKLAGYAALNESGSFERVYGQNAFNVLVITTSAVRCQRMAEINSGLASDLICRTFSEMGLSSPGGWS